MINLFSKKPRVITHIGSFHADDVFACATLSLLLKDRIKIIRTRDEEIIKTGDYVVDVGGIYDPDTNRFDHHQREGAGERSNGIPYASFGLVWKKFGKELCGSQEIADMIDQVLVQPIDASDSGVDISKPIFEGTEEYSMGVLVSSFRPTWQEDISADKTFPKALKLAKEILLNEIKRSKAAFEAHKVVTDAYNKATDKRLIIIEESIRREDIVATLVNFPETLFGVYPNKHKEYWQVVGIKKILESFELRKKLPKAWAGLGDEELAKASGVADATFCHRDLFLTAAKSKEGALKLAQLAVEN